LEAGDQLLFCTDGLNAMLSEEMISLSLQTAATPDEACQSLIESANTAAATTM
jgi:serine/threonine protein phosphatase PrpC